MTAPSAEDFRALARSSPWRWSTLRFTLGQGHDLRIEAVDEPMDDDLFREPRRAPSRRRGWAPLQ